MRRLFSRYHIAYAMELRTLGYSWPQLDLIFGAARGTVCRAVRRAEDYPEAYPEVTTGVFPIDVARAGEPRGGQHGQRTRGQGFYIDPTDGEMATLKALAAKHHLGYETLRNRIYHACWPIEQALTTPLRGAA